MAGAGPVMVAAGSISAMDSHGCPFLTFRKPKPWRHSLQSSSCFKVPCRASWRRRLQRKTRRLVIVSEIAGQYEEGFDDVHEQLINNFTQKAVRTVLYQLHEMNPPKYMWFYNFVASNDTTDGKLFLRTLGKEMQDLAERVMVTRLHLYGKWIKKCDHAKMYQRISDENLALMRERLMETVIWPSDDSNYTTQT
ncbi:hypothetical protein J5N97_015570 [Dioscorea zingiberensis]|uniref:Chaperonin-like RbcX protein 2, chloroplastic n=1 Tax=Dioscorea zingiberensis TaxID=325984 RepID=A0A9D5HEQ9_9LILI|nr:hypothetical protein J5N97_015570 [Dioscorea zingiberensis]